MASNVQENVEYAQPKTIQERQEVAGACTLGLKLTLPAYLDDMENSADRTFNGWPERLIVLSSEGRLIYQGGKGPYGFDLDSLESFLQDLVEKSL